MMEILVGIAVLYMVLLITATVYILYNRFRTISQYREIAYLKEIKPGEWRWWQRKLMRSAITREYSLLA